MNEWMNEWIFAAQQLMSDKFFWHHEKQTLSNIVLSKNITIYWYNDVSLKLPVGGGVFCYSRFVPQLLLTLDQSIDG